MSLTMEHEALRDVVSDCRKMVHSFAQESRGLVGYGWAELRDEQDRVWDEVLGREVGRLKLVVPFCNLITDTGDAYYAAKGIAAIAPASPSAPTALTGMQIGSGSTAVAKAGAGGAMVTLLAGQAFDATFPSTSNLGAGLGVNMVYKTTYAAGTGTGTVNEATITNGTIGTASTVANTISRVLTGAIVKGAADSLAITWNHKNLGA